MPPSRRGRRRGGDLRLVGEVAAGHHHRAIEAPRHEQVQRRGRQHEAERAQAGRDGVGERFGPVGAQEHDRRLRAGGARLFLGVDRAVAADDVEIGGHQRERLGVAALRARSLDDGRRVVASHARWIAAQALDGDDLAALQEAATASTSSSVECRSKVHGAAVETDQAGPRPAGVAGGGLGVEAAIRRIGGTPARRRRTEREGRQRGLARS